MAFVTVTCIAVALVVLVYYLYAKFNIMYSYWETRGVKGPKPVFPYGNLKRFLTKKVSFFPLIHEFCKQYPDEKVIGIYLGFTPALIVRDMSLQKRIFVKDYLHFQDRGLEANSEAKIMKTIVTMTGERWHNLRNKLTTIFSSGKMKQIIPILNSSTNYFMDHVDETIDDKVPLEARDFCKKYAVKSTAAAHFGLHVDENETNILMKRLNNAMKQLRFFMGIVFMLRNIGIRFLDKCMQMVPGDDWNYFAKLVNKIIKENKEYQNPKRGNHLIDFLIDLKEQDEAAGGNSNNVVEITKDIVIAQALLFAFSSLESTSGVMSYTLYELALNQNVQNRCYKEVHAVMKKFNGQITYESLNEFEYLSMTFDEALRKLIGLISFRRCTKNYEIPELNLSIKRGTIIIIDMSSRHNDSKYFQNPEKFDPERFTLENKGKLTNFAYMPFGLGPRRCIAKRYAKIHAMVGLAHFIYRYRVTPSKKTPKTITYDPKHLFPVYQEDIWVNIERRAVE